MVRKEINNQEDLKAQIALLQKQLETRGLKLGGKKLSKPSK